MVVSEFHVILRQVKTSRNEVEGLLIEMLCHGYYSLKYIFSANLAHVRVPIYDLILSKDQFWPWVVVKDHDVGSARYREAPIVLFFDQGLEQAVSVGACRDI